ILAARASPGARRTGPPDLMGRLPTAPPLEVNPPALHKGGRPAARIAWPAWLSAARRRCSWTTCRTPGRAPPATASSLASESVGLPFRHSPVTRSLTWNSAAHLPTSNSTASAALMLMLTEVVQPAEALTSLRERGPDLPLADDHEGRPGDRNDGHRDPSRFREGTHARGERVHYAAPGQT